jgi:hypothetical protein
VLEGERNFSKCLSSKYYYYYHYYYYYYHPHYYQYNYGIIIAGIGFLRYDIM